MGSPAARPKTLAKMLSKEITNQTLKAEL